MNLGGWITCGPKSSDFEELLQLLSVCHPLLIIASIIIERAWDLVRRRVQTRVTSHGRETRMQMHARDSCRPVQGKGCICIATVQYPSVWSLLLWRTIVHDRWLPTLTLSIQHVRLFNSRTTKREAVKAASPMSIILDR